MKPSENVEVEKTADSCSDPPSFITLITQLSVLLAPRLSFAIP